nr:uncharacterized protein LOC116830873 [Chelonoidis abingdonii]
MSSCTFVVQNPRLHMRCFQAWLATVYKPNVHSLNKQLTIPYWVKDSFIWWTVPDNLCSGVPFLQTPPTVMMATDASLTSWGAHISHQTIRGLWSHSETSLHINVLEFRAIRNACRCFLPLIKNPHVHIMTDNIACMFYVNRQAGARSHSLLKGHETLELVPCEPRLDISCLHPRRDEHHCRRAKQTFPFGARMGDRQENHSQHISHSGSRNRRSLRNREKHEMPQFLLQGGTGETLPRGRIHDLMAPALRLCFSPNTITQQGPHEDTDGSCQDNLDRTFMAETTVVPVPHQNVNSTTDLLASHPEPLITAAQPTSSPQSLHASPQSLVPAWFSQRELDCSEQVQRVLLHSRTQSTHTTYLRK